MIKIYGACQELKLELVEVFSRWKGIQIEESNDFDSLFDITIPEYIPCILKYNTLSTPSIEIGTRTFNIKKEDFTYISIS